MLPWRLPAIACRHAAGGRFGKQLGLWSKFRVWTVTKLSCKYGIKIYLDLEGTSSLKMEPSWGCTSDVCPRPLDNAPPAPAVRSRQDKVNGISEHGSFLRSSRGSESLLLGSPRWIFRTLWTIANIVAPFVACSSLARAMTKSPGFEAEHPNFR